MGNILTIFWSRKTKQVVEDENILVRYPPTKISKKNIEQCMRKLTSNFYSITRKGSDWTDTQRAVIQKYINYSIFKPIPRAFIDTIYGEYDEETGNCTFLPPKFVMFNFDYCKGKRRSLRGIACISIDGVEEVKSFKGLPALEINYYNLDLIGNVSIGNGPAAAAKARHKSGVKNGKDMLEYWKKFGEKSSFSYFKLHAMENVLGFYWKQGFRFNYRRNNARACDEKILTERIQLIDKLNKRSNLNNYEEKEREKLLARYFDRYMPTFYNEKEMSKNNFWDPETDYCKGNTTLERSHFDLRYHGYPMYYFF